MPQPLQYLTDAQGNKVAVVLPLAEYGSLIEDLLEDLYLAKISRETEGDELIPFEQVMAELKCMDSAISGSRSVSN